MRDAIAERAKRNGRSMNSEIVQILQDALEGKELPPSFHSEVPVDLTLEEDEFYSLPREEQLALIEKADPLQAAIERVSDSYSKKMAEEVKRIIIEFKKPT